MTVSQPKPKQDGRRLRSAASRRRIVEAMRDLIREGTVSPRAEEVAARADVGLRSVFRHFDDMESLYREIGDLILADIAPMLELPPPSGTAEEILQEMIDRRTKLFERIMPFRVAADMNAHRSPFLAEDRTLMNSTLRDIMRSSLPASLRKDKVVVDALDAVLSVDFWRRLRFDQRLSISQARKVVELTAAPLMGLKR